MKNAISIVTVLFSLLLSLSGCERAEYASGNLFIGGEAYKLAEFYPLSLDYMGQPTDIQTTPIRAYGISCDGGYRYNIDIGVRKKKEYFKHGSPSLIIKIKLDTPLEEITDVILSHSEFLPDYSYIQPLNSASLIFRNNPISYYSIGAGTVRLVREEGLLSLFFDVSLEEDLTISGKTTITLDGYKPYLPGTIEVDDEALTFNRAYYRELDQRLYLISGDATVNTHTGEITGGGTVITAKYVLPDGEGFVQEYQRPFNRLAVRMTEIIYAKSSNFQSGSVTWLPVSEGVSFLLCSPDGLPAIYVHGSNGGGESPVIYGDYRGSISQS